MNCTTSEGRHLAVVGGLGHAITFRLALFPFLLPAILHRRLNSRRELWRQFPSSSERPRAFVVPTSKVKAFAKQEKHLSLIFDFPCQGLELIDCFLHSSVSNRRIEDGEGSEGH